MQMKTNEIINKSIFINQRPTTQQLRRFKFVSTTKPTKYLVELIIRYQRWKKNHENGQKSDNESSSDEEM